MSQQKERQAEHQRPSETSSVVSWADQGTFMYLCEHRSFPGEGIKQRNTPAQAPEVILYAVKFFRYSLKPDKNLNCFCSEEYVQWAIINYYYPSKKEVLGIGFIFA